MQAPCHNLAVLSFLCNYNRLGKAEGGAGGVAGPPKYIFSIRPPARRNEKVWFFRPIRRPGAA
jgi:hypothetical protein